MHLYKQEIKDRKVGSWRYGLGVIASRENKLLSNEDVDRLYAAENKEEFDRLRTELGYGGDNFSEVLEAAQKSDIELLADLMPNSKFLQVLLLENDLHNLKATIKASLLADGPLNEADLERLYVAPYTVEPVAYLNQLKGESNDLPKDYRELISSADQIWHHTYNPADVDSIIDQFYWQRLDQALSELDNQFLQGFYRIKRDLSNLETLLRAYQLELGSQDFEKSLLPAGDLDDRDLANWLVEGKDNLLQKLEYSDYAPLKEVISNYGRAGSASAYQAASDNFLAQYIRHNLPSGAGPERILAYFFAREQERKNIELARIALVNKLDQTRISEIKREVVL